MKRKDELAELIASQNRDAARDRRHLMIVKKKKTEDDYPKEITVGRMPEEEGEEQ